MLSEQAAAMSALGAPRYALFLRIAAANGPVRAWSGVGDFAVPADGEIETADAIYLGVGILGDVPSFRQLVGGTAERVEFSLTVPDGDVFALADQDVDQVRNARVNVGVAFFDDDWQTVDGVAWLWDGVADVPSVNRTSTPDSISRSISLSVGSAFTDRTRPRLSYYTDSEQRRRSPTDAFCSRTGLYSIESTIVWPG